MVIGVQGILLSSLGSLSMTRVIDVTQNVNIGLSLLTNLVATLIISLKVWYANLPD